MKESREDIESSLRFRVSFILFLCIFFACHIHQFIVAKATYSITPFGRGGDFRDFYLAGIRILNGGPLYPDFIKPPLYGLLMSLFSVLQFKTALTVYQIATLVLVFGTAALVIQRLTTSFWVRLSALAGLAGNWGLWFLVDRGNADGISSSLALLACLAVSSSAHVLGWVLFAIAVNIKTNVLIIAPALVLSSTIKETSVRILCVATLTVLVALITPMWACDWINVALSRVRWTSGNIENVSVFQLFTPFRYGHILATGALISSGIFCFAGCWLRNLQSGKTNAIKIFLLLLPFSCAYPPLIYPYALVFSPLLAFLYGTHFVARGLAGKVARLSAWVGVLGLSFQYIPVLYLKHFVAPEALLLPVIPAGILLTIIANTILSWNPEVYALPLATTKTENRFAGNLAGKGLAITILMLSLYSTTSYFGFNNQQVLWLSDYQGFKVVSWRQDWGNLQYGRSVMGGRLTIAGQEYDRGIGTHGSSRVVIDLDKGTTLFKGAIGVDDAARGRAAGLIGIVRIGNRDVFRSKPLLPGDSPVSFAIATDSASTIELVVESAGSNNSWNLANWVNLQAE